MRSLYFFDTEFIEDGSTIDLISIGIVCDDGRSYYAESSQVDWSKASQWVLDNVCPHLSGATTSRATIAAEVLKFVNHGANPPEFWAYYADYDWVALCQLYGTMMDLPKSWPILCMDIKQAAIMAGIDDLPQQTSTEHNALADAHWNVEAFKYLASPVR